MAERLSTQLSARLGAALGSMPSVLQRSPRKLSADMAFLKYEAPHSPQRVDCHAHLGAGERVPAEHLAARVPAGRAR